MSAPEIAFAGRSNVGKSSLINALTGRRALARTSNTPGRTQQLIFFGGSDRLVLTDMPGYGYAAVAKSKVAAWTDLIHDYLRGRATLARVYVLIDARHGLKDVDDTILDTLEQSRRQPRDRADQMRPGRGSGARRARRSGQSGGAQAAGGVSRPDRHLGADRRRHRFIARRRRAASGRARRTNR